LLAAILLNGCLKEDVWCPEINVSFAMEDEFLDGDFDSRIQNEVLLYIFNQDKLVYSETIPYEKLSRGTEYSIPKTPELLGDLKFVAWAVKSDETHVGSGDTLTVHHYERHPEYQPGDDYNDIYLAHSELASRSPGGETQYAPHHHERYLGTIDPIEDEVWHRHSYHDIILHPVPGRVEVNITDPGNYFAGMGSRPHVVVEGGMSHMRLGDPNHGRTGRNGYGVMTHVRADAAPVPAGTRAAGDPAYTSGLIGVLPSKENTPLTVYIMEGDNTIKTFTVSSENTEGNFTALHSGDHLVFDYNVDSAEFAITVNGFEIKLVDQPL
jgi:hypothetical protein